MKKKAFRFSIWIAAVLLAAVSLLPAAAAEQPPLRLMIVSDLHYLSPSLYEGSEEIFEAALKKGDGKMTRYSRELLDGLMQEARHQRPDALIVSGDLTFNGERVSHLELAAAFAQLRAEGIPVWVIPGNHDLSYPYAGGYDAEGRYVRVPDVSPEEFRAVYSASMRPAAGQSHMSYAVPLNESLLLALCDVCIYDPLPETAGRYTDQIHEWLQGVLAEAKAAGMQVVTVTHQSLIPHTAFLQSSMAIENGARMAQLLRASGIARLNLSGHLHVQHIAGADGLFDIAAGAFSMPPFRYGLLTVREDGAMAYEAGALCREHLPEDVARRAETWFEEIVIEKERPQLEALGIPEADRERMLAYAAALNHAYFSGDLASAGQDWKNDPAYPLWMDIRSRDSFAGYLTALPDAPENGQSALRLALPAPDQER